MDKIWYRNPSKSEVIDSCGGDEKKELPRRTDKKSIAYQNVNSLLNLPNLSLSSYCEPSLHSAAFPQFCRHCVSNICYVSMMSTTCISGTVSSSNLVHMSRLNSFLNEDV